MKKGILLLAALGLSSPSFAMLCPTNFNEYNIGDSLETVQQTCGKPDKETKSEAKPSVPQEWVYFVRLGNSGNMAYSNNAGSNSAATMRMTIAFNKDKVTNMTVNGIGVSATPACGSNVQVGDTLASVKATCGAPVMVNQSNVPTGSSADTGATKVIEWLYNTGATPTTLVFENGKLTKRK
jgi:hypothetical protein